MTKASEHQPEPTGNGKVVLDYVLADIRERAEAGKTRYGCYLKTNNGRDSLVDAYQEAIDLVMYLRQLLLERENDKGFCKWEYDEPYDVWVGECGYQFVLSYPGTLEENKAIFCPYCGRKIAVGEKR